MDIRHIKLWPSQREFFEAGPQPVFYLAGVGSGKTFAGCLKILYLLDKFPGSRAVIVRQRFSQLKKTVAPTLFKLLHNSQIARRNDNEGSLRLTNGSEILMIHLDSPDSIDNLKSLEVNFCYVDQVEDISAEAWDTLYERLGRWSGATHRGGWPKDWQHKNRLGENIPPRYALLAGYSPGYDHWLTARFWEHGSERETYRARGYRVIKGSTRDNLALSEEYLNDRLSQGTEYVRRFVDAEDWGAKEGRIFTLHPQSIIEPSKELFAHIHRSMRLHRALDHGEMSPTACLWYATDNKQNIIVYREYMAADMLVSEHRAAIYELSKLDGYGGDPEPPKYYSNIADPAIFAKNRGRTVNSVPTYGVSDEWAEVRVVDRKTAVYWTRGNNDEAMTINRIKEYLRLDPRHYNPFTKMPGGPRLYFVRRTPEYPHGCHEVLTDIRAARRVEVGVAPDGSKLFGDERDEKVRDHLLDCLRYGVGARPALGVADTEPAPEPGTIRMKDYDKLIAQENSRAAAQFRRDFKGKSPAGR